MQDPGTKEMLLFFEFTTDLKKNFETGAVSLSSKSYMQLYRNFEFTWEIRTEANLESAILGNIS